MVEFDLDDPPVEQDESPASRRRRERRSREGKSTDQPASDSRSENALTQRLNEAFSKLAEQLLAKGDEELGTAIREERNGMTSGLVSLTRTVTFLRSPLIFALELAFVLLAFWRVGGILLRRLFAWRQRVMVERAQYEQQAEEYPEPPPMPEGAVVT